MRLNPEFRQQFWAPGVHRAAALFFRLYIGGIFIYASMGKVAYSAEFAEIIAAYRIVPHWGVNLLAVTLPWAELICGFLLIIGVRVKAAAAILAGLLVIFSLAIVLNLMRGISIGCGCFSSIDEPMTWKTFLRDLVWLAMTVHIYFHDSLLHFENRFMMKIKDL